MKKHILWALLFNSLVACSGGSSEDFTLSGSWSGNLRQVSGLHCAGGTFTGAGIGTISEQKTWIEIMNGDVVGESGILVSSGSDCEYTGIRSNTDSMTFGSDNTSCWESILASDFGRDRIFLEFYPHPPRLLADGTPTCVGLFDGEFSRE